METARVSPKFQVVIAKRVLRRLAPHANAGAGPLGYRRRPLLASQDSGGIACSVWAGRTTKRIAAPTSANTCSRHRNLTAV